MLLYALALKFSIFISPVIPQPQKIDGFLYKAILSWLKPIGQGFPTMYPLITFILLYSQAIYFNKLVNDQRIMPKPQYLTGMSYLLLTSMFIEWNSLSAPLIVNSLLIWVWSKMSGLYNNPNPKSALFSIGLAIGLATFFYFPSLAFVAMIIFGLAVTRAFKLAEWLISFLGILTPYYFLFGIVFLTDNWKIYNFPGFAVTTPEFHQTYWTFIASTLVLISAILGVFFIQQNFRRQLIQARKSWNLVFIYLMVALFVPFVNSTHTFEYWILCAIPLSALLSATFFYPKRNWFPSSLHWLMVSIVIAVSYFFR